MIAAVIAVSNPVFAQDTAQPMPPEHQQRMYGPSYEQRTVTDPNLRAAEQFPHLSGKPPATAPVPSVVPPQPPCRPQNSTVQSTDPQNSATSPPSCP
jgi:hypothetical protein